MEYKLKTQIYLRTTFAKILYTLPVIAGHSMIYQSWFKCQYLTKEEIVPRIDDCNSDHVKNLFPDKWRSLNILFLNNSLNLQRVGGYNVDTNTKRCTFCWYCTTLR